MGPTFNLLSHELIVHILSSLLTLPSIYPTNSAITATSLLRPFLYTCKSFHRAAIHLLSMNLLLDNRRDLEVFPYIYTGLNTPNKLTLGTAAGRLTFRGLNVNGDVPDRKEMIGESEVEVVIKTIFGFTQTASVDGGAIKTLQFDRLCFSGFQKSALEGITTCLGFLRCLKVVGAEGVGFNLTTVGKMLISLPHLEALEVTNLNSNRSSLSGLAVPPYKLKKFLCKECKTINVFQLIWLLASSKGTLEYLVLDWRLPNSHLWNLWDFRENIRYLTIRVVHPPVKSRPKSTSNNIAINGATSKSHSKRSRSSTKSRSKPKSKPKIKPTTSESSIVPTYKVITPTTPTPGIVDDLAPFLPSLLHLTIGGRNACSKHFLSDIASPKFKSLRFELGTLAPEEVCWMLGRSAPSKMKAEEKETESHTLENEYQLESDETRKDRNEGTQNEDEGGFWGGLVEVQVSRSRWLAFERRGPLWVWKTIDTIIFDGEVFE